MKTIEFQFSVSLSLGTKTFDLCVPFDNGLVYGGELCPFYFSQEPSERPFHWYRAEEFVAICDNQVSILPKVEKKINSCHNLLAYGVMEAVKNRIDKAGFITLNHLVSELDCFSLLIFSDALRDAETIKREYGTVMRYLIDCYPMKILYENPKVHVEHCNPFSWLIKEK